MSGHKRFLSPKKRIVIDTHVLQAATLKEMHTRHPSEQPPENSKQENDAYELIREVIKNSPVLVFSPEQWKEAQKHVYLRHPSTYDIIRELDEKNKLERIEASRLEGALPTVVIQALKGKRGKKHSSPKKGHKNVSDDIHLFEAAFVTDKILITEDVNILDNEEIKKFVFKKTNIQVFRVQEALAKHEATKDY